MEVFGVHVTNEQIILFYMFHLIISIVLAFFVSIYIQKRYDTSSKASKENDKKRLEAIANRSLLFKFLFRISLHRNNPLASFLFFFIFNLSLPIFGYIASLWLGYYLLHIKYDQKFVSTNILNLDEFGYSFLKVERIFGEGSMVNVVLAEEVPKSKKLKALSSLSSNISPMTLRIIKQTLASKNDEIRMYGYAIINKIEKKLNENINKHLEIYNDKSLDDATRYEAAKELAYFYWEMVYAELSHDSLKESFIKEVVKYVDIAKGYYRSQMEATQGSLLELNKELNDLRTRDIIKKEDLKKIEELEKKLLEHEESNKNYKDTSAKLYILMGRVYMMKKEYENAVEEFTMAQELSESDFSFVLPYLAEIYYILRKFPIAKSIMNKAESLDLNPKLHPIVAQWSSSNDRA